jgi:superfamily I DNA and/or RNA helicase
LTIFSIIDISNSPPLLPEKISEIHQFTLIKRISELAQKHRKTKVKRRTHKYILNAFIYLFYFFCEKGDSPSYFNLAEIETIDLYLTQLLDDQIRDKKLKFLKPSHIGIISPYRGQLQKIKKVIAEKKYGADLKVGSVEEFQGQERCVIIISSVRSFNSFSSKERKLQIGFLNNPKRFNVAITRAQALVIVVGNPFMLKADDNWEK